MKYLAIPIFLVLMYCVMYLIDGWIVSHFGTTGLFWSFMALCALLVSHLNWLDKQQ